MEYKIFGDNLPGLTVYLDKGESMYTQSGGMAWMSDGIQMDTNLKGGLFKGIGRMFSGESLFMATYTASKDHQEITFASTFPGNILKVDLQRGKELICQKDAFLCAQPTVDLGVEFTKKFSSGLFGGEGFILQRISGEGKAFLEITGSVVERELAPGEVIKVDTGNIVAFERGVKYEIETIKGFKNILFGGEGLFLTKMTGPGKIWLQTITMQNFAGRIAPFLPLSNS